MTESPERIRFLEWPVDRISIPETLEWMRQAVLCGGPVKQIAVVNANKFHMMSKNHILHDIVVNADLIIPEWAVVWAARQLNLPALHHVGGSMVAAQFMPYAAEHGISLYLLGAEPEVVEHLARKLRDDLPRLRIAGFHHGYLNDPESEREVISDIKRSRPDVLFVAMGSPKQEFWIHEHRDDLGVPVSIGVGGTFDVLAGVKRDVPGWARGKGLEWVYRMMQDPGRYGKRYMVTNSWFVARVLWAKLAV